MVEEITRKLSAQDWLSYAGRLLIYPLETAVRLSPAVLLACYLLLRGRPLQPETAPDRFRAGWLIAALCISPYWLTPQGGIRYLLPVFPLVALVSARIIWRAGETSRKLALRWFAAIIVFKFVFALILFPYYQSHYRGENYTEAGRSIMQLTAGHPLYVTDVGSPGLCVTGYLDAQRFPQAPITFPPAQWDNGFVIARSDDPSVGKLVRHYRLAADDLFVLCRGAACATTGN
jgi:hypothetical protein